MHHSGRQHLKAPVKRSQHFNATLIGATCCVRLATLLRRVATCWVFIYCVVGSNLKMVKIFMQHLWMMHDVVVVWSGSCNNVGLGMGTSLISTRNMSQHVETGWPNACKMFRQTMLRSLGRSLQMLGQQCWDMLR